MRGLIHTFALLFLALTLAPLYREGAAYARQRNKGDSLNATAQLKGASAIEPSWTPDSKRIVFSSSHKIEERRIYIIDADGSNIKPLTQNTSADVEPMMSPNRKKILFAAYREGSWKLYVMNADGLNARSIQITTSDNLLDLCRAAWSPDGKRIAFPMKGSIDIANADGSAVMPLTNANGENPRWSPDGKQIAFVNSADRNIYVIGADGTGLMKVTASEPPNRTNFPSWSPDGKRIFYIENGREKGDIYSVYVNGSDKKKITDLPFKLGHAMVSPDGSRILYVTTDKAMIGDKPMFKDILYVVNADGSGNHMVLDLRTYQ